MNVTNHSTFVGIDVSKKILDVAVRPSEKTFRAANDAEGIAKLVMSSISCAHWSRQKST